MDAYETVTIPADIDREDRVLANLSARQLAILIPAGALVWLAYMSVGTVVPLPVFAGLAVPFVGAAAALALVERDGLPLHRLAGHAIIQASSPRRLAPAPGPLSDLPAWVSTHRHDEPFPAPLRLPARAIRADGAINLGADGVAVIVECSTVSFALRTPTEQAGLVDGLGTWLNSLTGPAQILVRAQPINLTPAITLLRQGAATLPHPALEEAALDHARFLTELAATRDLFARQVLIVLREPHNTTPVTSISGQTTRQQRDADATAIRALRRAEQTVRALVSVGINASVLDGVQASAVVAACADPTAPPMDHRGQAAPERAITAKTTNEVGRR